MPTYVLFDEPIIVTCDRCGGGRGDFVNPCDWCGATGGVPVDFSYRERLATLSHNIAIGAALCRAWKLGRNSNASFPIIPTEWRPGCGKPAP